MCDSVYEFVCVCVSLCVLCAAVCAVSDVGSSGRVSGGNGAETLREGKPAPRCAHGCGVFLCMRLCVFVCL